MLHRPLGGLHQPLVLSISSGFRQELEVKLKVFSEAGVSLPTSAEAMLGLFGPWEDAGGQTVEAAQAGPAPMTSWTSPPPTRPTRL